MARKQQKAEDPWSGFVDVLSNVVMVVTFIVIILCISMLVLSQAIAENIAKKIIESQCAEAGIHQGDKETVSTESPPENVNKAQDDQSKSATSAPDKADPAGSEGSFKVTRARPALHTDEIEGEQDLTIRARPDEDRNIDSAISEEEVITESGKIINASAAVAKIEFASNSHTLTEEAHKQVLEKIQSGGYASDQVFEVRAIALSNIGSISEARRLAYYRAMQIRDALLEADVPPENILARIRESGAKEADNSVYIYAK
jgi:Tfp pilus assembly protein PilX